MNQVEQTVEALIAKGNIELLWLDIDEVKEDEKNPRHISDQGLADLKKSITDFPDMMRLRPGVIRPDNTLMGGNQRHRACKQLGWAKFPVIRAENLTEEQLKEFIIKDNLPYGEWDMKVLKAEWNTQELGEWGMDITELMKAASIPGEIVFATELDQESNFVVLKFNRDIDWLQIQTVLGIKSVHSQRQNGKPWSKGVGRVVDGVEAINSIIKSGKEL